MLRQVGVISQLAGACWADYYSKALISQADNQRLSRCLPRGRGYEGQFEA